VINQANSPTGRESAKPFLKWAGGKTQLLSEIGASFPFQAGDKFTYVEPFVGGGAVLFWVLNNFYNVEKVVLNDINRDLTGTYMAVATSVDSVIDWLKLWESEYHLISDDQETRRAYYNNKRSLFNERSSPAPKQAALMIFLNKTGFNGLFRVNRKNEFNVPIGSYRKPVICNEESLRSASIALDGVEILSGDFEETLFHANENSFFYIDPPYKPISETAHFTSYSKDGFHDEEQKRLKVFCDNLAQRKCKWILSNSDPIDLKTGGSFFDALYAEYSITRVFARRNINSNPDKRGKQSEILIRNFC
jgi:DNA adenine methylase